MTLQLTAHERAMLAGNQGDAVRLAMRVLTELAKANGAPRLVPIKSAHVGGILYNGRSSLDFARHLNSLDARVAVPTTLNAGSVDLRKPDAYHGDPSTAKLVTVLPAVRGSNAGGTVLLESTRQGTSPSAIVLNETNQILTIGSIIGKEIYGVSVPIVVLPGDIARRIRNGDHVTVVASRGAGRVQVTDSVEC